MILLYLINFPTKMLTTNPSYLNTQLIIKLSIKTKRSKIKFLANQKRLELSAESFECSYSYNLKDLFCFNF